MLPVNSFLKLMGNTVIGMELLNLLSEQEKKKKTGQTTFSLYRKGRRYTAELRNPFSRSSSQMVLSHNLSHPHQQNTPTGV